MDMKVIEKKDAKLLKRKEYVLSLKWSKGVPSRKEIKDKFLALTNEKEDTCVVKKIITSFGKSEGKVIVYVYNDPNVMKQLENKSMLEKNFPKKEDEEKKEE